jgi:hypothetical protein
MIDNNEDIKEIINRLGSKLLKVLRDSDEASYPAAVLMNAAFIARQSTKQYLKNPDLTKDECEGFIHETFEMFAFDILNPTNEILTERFGEGINFGDYWISFLSNLEKLRENYK